jgi:hypothetical protein
MACTNAEPLTLTTDTTLPNGSTVMTCSWVTLPAAMDARTPPPAVAQCTHSSAHLWIVQVIRQ